MALITIGIGVSDAAMPRLINHQGRLTSVTGAPQTGSFAFTFRLYSAVTGGAPLWTENHAGVATDTEGLYSIMLGSVTPLTLDFDTGYFLSMEIDGGGEFSPRQALGAVPFAFRAAVADSLISGLTIGRITSTETVTAAVFVGSGSGLSGVAASSVNAQHIVGSIGLSESTVGSIAATRVTGTFSLVDSTTGALPLTRLSGDTITRSEVQNLQINLTDSVTGFVSAARISGRISISDSTTGTILGDSVNPARSTLNVDSPTFVVDAAGNRVGIDSNAPSATLSVGGQILARDTVTALSFVGSGASLTNVAASTVNAQNISGSIVIPDSVTGTLQASRITGSVSLVDSTSGALPITRVSGDTVTFTQARALTWTLADSTIGALPTTRITGSMNLVDSTSGALPITRVSGDTITRSEVQNLQINLTDSVTGFVSAARLSGRISISDSTTGTILGDSVNPTRSTLNVDSPTFVVDAAGNRVGIDSNAPQQTLSVGGQILARDTVTALSFVGSGASLTNVAASSVNAQFISGSIVLPDSVSGTLQVSRINGSVSLVDSTSGALPITRVSGDTVTYTQARALSWSLVDSTSGALPITRVSGDTITRSEVQNLQINLTDSVTGFVSAARLSGRVSISDSTTGTILGDSVNPTRSTLNVDSPTFVVDAAANRVGIDTNAPQQTLSVGGQILARDTVTALSFVGSGASLTNVAASSVNAQFISGSIVMPDSVSGTLQVSRINGSVSLVDSTTGALPITRVSGDTITYTGARALTWALVDSTTGALPLTRISGDTITRSEVQNLQINLTDSVTGFVSAARLSGRVSISDSTTGTILGDSVAAARSQLNVDSPTFVVDAAANRVGIDSNAPSATLSVGGQALIRDTVTALSFVGSGASLTNVAAASINAQFISGSIVLPDSVSGTLQVSRINGSVSLVDSTSGALPITRVSGDTVTRSEVQNLQINLTDSVTGFVSAARLSGRVSISDSTTGTILGDSVNPTRSTLNVDSPTFVVDAAANRVGIDTNTPQQTLSVGGQILARDTVTALSFVGSGASLTNVAASNINAQNIIGQITLPDSTLGTLPGDSIAAARSQLNVDTPTFVIDAANNQLSIGGAFNPADSITVAGGFSVDSPTLVVNSAVNRVGICTSVTNIVMTIEGAPGATPNTGIDTVRIFNANLYLDSGYMVMKTNSFFDGTWHMYPIPGGPSEDAIILFAVDTGFGAELRVYDENGNLSTLSPHNFGLAPRSESLAWSFASENRKIGGRINVDMLKVVRIVERLSGQKLVYVSPFDGSSLVDLEALDRYLDGGGTTIPSELERLETENRALKMQMEFLLRRIEALESR